MLNNTKLYKSLIGAYSKYNYNKIGSYQEICTIMCNTISFLRNDNILFKQSFYRLSAASIRSSCSAGKSDDESKMVVNTERIKNLQESVATTSKDTEDEQITQSDNKKEATDDTENDVDSDDIFTILNILKDLSENNISYFKTDDTEFGQRLYESYRGINCHIENLKPLIIQIQELAPQYDYDVSVPANGYRSFLLVVHSGVKHTIGVTKLILLKRDQMLFRKGFYVREVEACSHLLASLQQCLEYLRTLSKWSPIGDLFLSENHTPYDLLSTQTPINQYCFYGRCLGFQFCEAMRNILKFIILCMTSFSEVYFSRGNLLSKATNSVWVSGKYFIDPELRAKRVVNLSQNASIDFCKAFWFLADSEIMQIIPKITPKKSVTTHNTIRINKCISIPPEPLEYKVSSSSDDSDVTTISIPIPTAHIGIKPIQVRLISALSRDGMIGEGSVASGSSPGGGGGAATTTTTTNSKSNNLLIHCHGGGFVAQSSRSHLVYLKEWAIQLNIPILSIDYSLAPEAPYPRAVQEILYAYVWALNNAHLLGTTAKNIIFAGDSAGANLVSVLALKCIELNIQRPNGIFLAYVPIVLNFKPTPARMLCLMDPLLPLGFMLRCIKSYTNNDNNSSSSPTLSNNENENENENNSFEQITTSDLLNAHKSNITIICTTDNTTDDTLTNISDNDNDNDNDDDWIKLDKTLVDDKNTCFNTFVHEIDIDENDVCLSVLEESSRQQCKRHYYTTTLSSSSSSKNDNTNTSTSSTKNKIKQRMTKLVNVITNTFNKWRTTTSTTNDDDDHNKLNTSNNIIDNNDNNIDDIIKEFNINVPNDSYLSPYHASDEIIKQLPSIRILTVEMDPCLDDCVTYAKKLKHLECDVQLDVLKGLPHGFLNFSLFSKEAQDGSQRCIDRIQELFNLYKEEDQIENQDQQENIKDKQI